MKVTTENVRCAYIADWGWHSHDSGADFDQWLQAERNKARLEILEDMRDTLWAYGPKGAMQYLNRMIELYR